MARTIRRDWTALIVPSVAVLGIVRLAGVPVTVVTVPLPKVVERKSRVSADAVIVNALDATDAEIG
jgi:ABC-type Na+ efflux pump permease subunit